MRRIRQVKMLFGLVNLSLLVWGSTAMGQPAMHFYNVTGQDFVPICASGGKTITSRGCFKKTNCSLFSFPVNLPNGSVVKYLEMFFIRHDESMVLNYNYLNLMKIDPGVSQTYLIDIQNSGPTGPDVQRKKSSELSDIINNQNYFYQLLYEALSPADVELCGARIYYQLPSNMSYLPMMVK